MKTVLFAVLGAVAVFIMLNIIMLIIKLLQKPAPEKENDYEQKMNIDPEALTYVYSHLSGYGDVPSGIKIDEEYINRSVYVTCNWMNKRYDCSDFRFQLLFRLYKDCSDKLPQKSKDMIKKTILDFKYFMDEPGDDSMCFWSENHQILFATAEYLAGQEFPDEIFTNSKMTGTQHMKKALERVNAWQEQRFNFGFSEFLSNVYLMEDIAPMANYIEYSRDQKTVQSMKIIMDLLWFDVALNTVNNRFCAVSSRMYAESKAGNTFGNSIGACMNLLWGEESLMSIMHDGNSTEEEKKQMQDYLMMPPNKMSINFYAMYKKGCYELPPVIKKIALFRGTEIIKMSSGLSPKDLKEENLVGEAPHQIMAQLGAETFTNPEVINNTIRYFKKNRMFRNSMVNYFKYFDIPIFKLISPEKIAEKFNMMTHGIALGRGNVYTYRTKDYSMSTVMDFDADRCGAQEHVWGVNIAEHLALFTTHPSRDDSVFGSSPGYWIGNGRRPMSVQNENVNITIYKIPKRKRLMEFKTAQMTHLYMPKDFYDRFEQKENYIFAQKNSVLVAVIASGKPEFRPFNEKSKKPFGKERHKPSRMYEYSISSEFDLCMFGGEYHFYVTEVSSLGEESFEQFKERILNNTVEFCDCEICYISNDVNLRAKYTDGLFVDGVKESTCYDRYDCAFCKAKRKDRDIIIEGFTDRLVLNLTEGSRIIN